MLVSQEISFFSEDIFFSISHNTFNHKNILFHHQMILNKGKYHIVSFLTCDFFQEKKLLGRLKLAICSFKLTFILQNPYFSINNKISRHFCHYVHPPGYIIFAFCAVRCPLSDVRRPMSGVTHGFRSFKGKVLELLSPNLICRLIGSVACLGLLLAVVPLLLTE